MYLKIKTSESRLFLRKTAYGEVLKFELTVQHDEATVLLAEWRSFWMMSERYYCLACVFESYEVKARYLLFGFGN